MMNTLQLIGEALWQAKEFSQAKTVMILQEMVEEYEAKVVDEGHMFAARRLKSRYSYYGLVQENLYGVAAIGALRDTLYMAKKNWDSVKNRLETMRKAIADGHRKGMILSITGEAAPMKTVSVYIKKFVDEIIPKNDQAQEFVEPRGNPHPWTQSLSLNTTAPPSEGLAIPLTVSYVGMAGSLYKEWTASPGSAAVVAQYVEDGYLYQRVKTEGGATDVYVKVRSGR
jgi:Zn-dependent M16 (insulinase) family peptidase